MRIIVALVIATLGCGAEDGSETEADAVLEFSHPETDLLGFTVYQPDDKRGDPRAGQPDYVYLIIGEEAVELRGPRCQYPAICSPSTSRQ